MAWIIPGGILCLAFVILGIGVAQFMGTNNSTEADGGGLLAGMSPDRDPGFVARAIATADRRTDERERTRLPLPSKAARRLPRQRNGTSRPTSSPPRPGRAVGNYRRTPPRSICRSGRECRFESGSTDRS